MHTPGQPGNTVDVFLIPKPCLKLLPGEPGRQLAVEFAITEIRIGIAWVAGLPNAITLLAALPAPINAMAPLQLGNELPVSV